MAKNRTQLFQDLSVDPTNSRWAWCAKNATIKKAVFTIPTWVKNECMPESNLLLRSTHKVGVV